MSNDTNEQPLPAWQSGGASADCLAAGYPVATTDDAGEADGTSSGQWAASVPLFVSQRKLLKRVGSLGRTWHTPGVS